MAPPKRRRMSLKEEALLLPNILTYGRIVVIPFVAWLMYADTLGTRFAAILLYTLAAITDYFDGYLARKRNLVSTVGKFLDPLADKLLVITILLILMWGHIVPGWVVIIIIAREISITALRALAGSEGLIIAAKPLGKYKTAFQMVALPGLMMHQTFVVNLGLVFTKLDFWRLGLVFLYISLFFSVISAVDYFAGFLRAHRDRERTRTTTGINT